jgi:16S rRNA (uracil1498-N3)-methyltransferase
MSAPRFFVPLPLALEDVGRELLLPDAVAHHALRVLRLSAGDAIALFTGAGGEYAATLTRAGKRDASARIDAFIASEREPALAIALVQAITASDTMDTIVRRAVELGAAEIQPVITSRSARFPAGAQGEKRLAHWQQVTVAACEQCGRNKVPPVREVVPLARWLEARSAGCAGIVLDPNAEGDFASLPPAARALDLLVGPEGGLVQHEVEHATRAGLRGARLGPRMLRADTASLAALATVNFLWGDLR